MLMRIGTRLAGLIASGLLAVGLAAFPTSASATPAEVNAGCWSFRFTGNFFPNPVNRVTHGVLKAEVQFLALGDDSQFYPADLSIRFYNSAGQLVLSGFVGTIQSAPTQQLPVADVTSLAAGYYRVYLDASTSICGGRSFNETIIVR